MSIARTYRISLIGLVCAAFLGCSETPESDASNNIQSSGSSDVALDAEFTEHVEAGPNRYAYSVLGPNGSASPLIFARVVYEQDKYSCPSISGSDGSLVTMSARTHPQVKSNTCNVSGNNDNCLVDNPNFPVTVCEALIQEGVSYTDKAGATVLHAVSLKPDAVQVYGDSGCKVGDCVDLVGNPFQALASVGTKRFKGLILHMGDYNYRGTGGNFAVSESGNKIYAYDAGDGGFGGNTCGLNDVYQSQNAANSPKPDKWSNWKLDFFEAAKPLLATAPWVFARGNHELCSRAGVGWFYFFGPGSNVPGSTMKQMQCPDQGDFNNPPSSAESHIAMIPPYMLRFEHFQTWVMDSANACDDDSGNKLTSEYQNQYELLANDKPDLPTWIVSHRPIWGYQGSVINVMLQTALKATPLQVLPKKVTLSLAGHMHLYESLTFFEKNGDISSRPPQIVVGNSGVSLNDVPNFEPCTDPQKGNCTDVDGLLVKGNALSEFGFLTMTVDTNGSWTGSLLDQLGDSIASCSSLGLAAGMPICDNVSVVGNKK